MRLNKNTYPAYSLLEEGRLIELQIDHLLFTEFFKTDGNDLNRLGDFMRAIEAMYGSVGNRYYITEPFKDAINTAYPKIIEGEKHIHDIPNDCGIIFTNNGFTLYLSNPADKQVKLMAFGFTRNALTTYAFLTNDLRYGGVVANLDANGQPFNDDDYLNSYINSLLTAIYFIHNCETEQKVLKPKEKHRANGEKHYNESNSNVVILDCKWFTELIRDTPFHVRGHLRWQVCGEGRKRRRLIWIEEFEKKGYHRKATKEVIE